MEEEIWKDIKGYEGLYQISSFGRVKSLERVTSQNKFLSEKLKIASLSVQGYFKVTLCKNGKCIQLYIHKLVAENFLDNPENKLQANHIDGIKINNHISNLEWVSPLENMTHARNLGLLNIKGENNHFHSLNESEVLAIRKLYSEGYTSNRLAKMYGVSTTCILLIKSRKTWKHI